MSKIMLAILTVAAFAYACWLVFFRKPLPDPRQATGMRWRFCLATLLFAGLLGSHGCQPTCYVRVGLPPPVTPPAPRHSAIQALKAVWRTLDPKRNDEFRQKLEASVLENALNRKVSDILAVAYQELSYHKARTRGDGPHYTCYDMSMLGVKLMDSREKALKQIELLAEARKAGTISKETADKAQAALTRELDMLLQAQAIGSNTDEAAKTQLIQLYKEDKLPYDPYTSAAAAVIVEMERER